MCNFAFASLLDAHKIVHPYSGFPGLLGGFVEMYIDDFHAEIILCTMSGNKDEWRPGPCDETELPSTARAGMKH